MKIKIFLIILVFLLYVINIFPSSLFENEWLIESDTDPPLFSDPFSSEEDSHALIRAGGKPGMDEEDTPDPGNPTPIGDSIAFLCLLSLIYFLYKKSSDTFCCFNKFINRTK